MNMMGTSEDVASLASLLDSFVAFPYRLYEEFKN
jgi:hypothetical protein